MTDDLVVIEEKERHTFRFLFKFVALVGFIYLAGRFLIQMKDEYTDLTESQARAKFMEKMAPRIGDENASEIADQVIPKLKERGLIRADSEQRDSVIED